MGKTISVSSGSVALQHDKREFGKDKSGKPLIPEHISQDMMMYNTYVKTCRSEREAFNFFFKDSVDEYNARQSRADRKKTDYYGEIQKSKNGEIPIYEYVFQIGNKEDTPCHSDDGLVCKRILFEYAVQFQKDNPNFHVISSCIHMDEETPHLHISFIPWAKGYKKGLEMRCSTSKALESMGYKGEERNMKHWKRKQEDKIEKMMNERGLDRVRLGGTREHLSVPLYKETMDKARADAEIEKGKILESAKTELNELHVNLSYAQNDYETVKAEYEDYLQERESLVDEISELQGTKDTLITEISRLNAFKGKLEKIVADWTDKIEKALSSDTGMGLKALEFIKSRNLMQEFQNFLNEPVKQLRAETESITTMSRMRNLVNRTFGSAETKTFGKQNEISAENENDDVLE